MIFLFSEKLSQQLLLHYPIDTANIQQTRGVTHTNRRCNPKGCHKFRSPNAREMFPVIPPREFCDQTSQFLIRNNRNKKSIFIRVLCQNPLRRFLSHESIISTEQVRQSVRVASMTLKQFANIRVASWKFFRLWYLKEIYMNVLTSFVGLFRQPYLNLLPFFC